MHSNGGGHEESHSVKVAWLHHAQDKGQQKRKVLTGPDGRRETRNWDWTRKHATEA